MTVSSFGGRFRPVPCGHESLGPPGALASGDRLVQIGAGSIFNRASSKRCVVRLRLDCSRGGWRVKDKVVVPATVIPIGAAKRRPPVPGKTVKESERIWGKDVMEQRFVILPKLLLRAQALLGLDAIQLNVLLHLIEHWWHAERQPYPSKKTIAGRMRVHQRTVQRAIAAMEKHGLVTRRPRHSARNGRKTNIYDLSGLVAKLKALAPDFKKEAEVAAARRRALEKPGRRAVAATTE